MRRRMRAALHFTGMIEYPGFDPVALRVGPLAIRWYGLMYLLGFIAAWLLAQRRSKRPGSDFTPAMVQDLVFYCFLGVILGGRLGYILFYGWEQILADPLYIVRIWEGGMSFHGGNVGVAAAIWLFARKYSRPLFGTADFVAPLAPIGLGAGRIGNFINNELWGKPSDVPWAFVVDGVGRHPTQLYEAFLEGVVLFAALWWYTRERRGGAPPQKYGAATGLFLAGYGIFRFLVEFLRLPDAHLGYLAFGWVTMGQLLSLPMIAFGLWLLARRNPRPA